MLDAYRELTAYLREGGVSLIMVDTDGRVEELLPAEMARQGFADGDDARLDAYRDACVAFLDERQESYNPIGIQYTFGRNAARSRVAAELEFELNWYSSRAEFVDLVALARALAGSDMSDGALRDRASELIGLAGAWPDQSIIVGYRAEPTLQKLPDYIVACVIEEIVCGRNPLE